MYFTSLTFFFLVTLELIFLSELVPIDFLVQQWIQDYRSCDLDNLAQLIKIWTSAPYLFSTIIVTIAGILLYRRRWEDIVCFVIIAAGGALVCEWLKLFVSRPRPSALAFIDYGNSFPSGHVTNAVTLLGAVYYTVSGRNTTKGWKRPALIIVVFVLAVIVGLQRIYFTHHWSTDVVAGGFLGFGWLFFAIDRLCTRVTAKSLGITGLLFATAFFTLWLFPKLQMRAPSPLTARGPAMSRVDLSAYAPAALKRSEIILDRGKPPVSVWISLHPRTNIDVTLPQERDYLVFFAARPESSSSKSKCNQIEILINERPLKNFTLREGFRDYGLRIDRNVVRSGSNQLTFNLPLAGTQSVGLVYVEAFPR